MNRKITYEELKEWLDYDDQSGIFRVLKSHHKSRIGTIAGSITKRGYISLSILGNTCRAHQIAWLYVYGEYPKSAIDHKDGNRSNNAIDNLRLIDPAGNTHNIFSAYSTSTSGLLGAHYCARKKRFKATLTVKGKRHFLGSFMTAAEAHDAYMLAKATYHPMSEAACLYRAKLKALKASQP